MADSFSSPQHEPALAHAARRVRGEFYTPVEVADWITRETYGPLLNDWTGETPPPRVLDPACGAGVFLQSACRLLRERCQQLGMNEAQQQDYSIAAIHGIDISADAVRTARQQLTFLPATNIQQADALTANIPGQFDAIIGNPPYVSIRELARSHSPQQVELLRQRFHTARGNFDLYVLFIERALELLRPGGRLGFIVPNKWATLDYARGLRELLLRETTLEQVVDLSSLKVFPQACTYPQIIVLRHQPAATTHRLRVCQVEDFAALQFTRASPSTRPIEQASLDSRAFVFGDDINVEQRVPTIELESLASLHSGASGYSANRLAAQLQEFDEMPAKRRGEAADFIVSGNIDRYEIKLGQVKFLKQKWQRPCLGWDSPQLTADKARLYREPKIVISGMSRRLEAAYDQQGCALGVQVYAARELQVDPFYLLGLLNSKLLSFLFRERFAAKRLAGGYLAVNKGQLAQLPIRIVNGDDPAAVKLQQQISNLARRLQSAYSVVIDQQLDDFVHELYQLSDSERQRVDQSFAPLKSATKARRAA